MGNFTNEMSDKRVPQDLLGATMAAPKPSSASLARLALAEGFAVWCQAAADFVKAVEELKQAHCTMTEPRSLAETISVRWQVTTDTITAGRKFIWVHNAMIEMLHAAIAADRECSVETLTLALHIRRAIAPWDLPAGNAARCPER